MDNEDLGVDADRAGARALARSELQDEIDILQRTASRTAGAGAAITALFLVTSLFMGRPGTLWLLGGMWVLITARLTAMHRLARRSELERQAELERLENPVQDSRLPPVP